MIPALVLLALVVLAAVSSRTGLGGSIALGLAGLAWLLVNSSVEGIVLLRFTPQNGLTGADLAGLAAIAIAGVRTVRILRTRRRTEA
ncbi:hypothetical protein [Pseudonocardia oroxyli]|uniref:Uncharacterized protein n=1 Tax=Pseudonocardia oroxyli TaxID=366584 RepID=A0A1G7Z8Z4_PSEOR|nr:hypothetical protein [Pseudonocardia oroxyli]SDH05178.1 hypothetical protein SAMN05216377_11867 [Pseudonocardia oroxyli]